MLVATRRHEKTQKKGSRLVSLGVISFCGSLCLFVAKEFMIGDAEPLMLVATKRTKKGQPSCFPWSRSFLWFLMPLGGECTADRRRRFG